MPRHDESFLLMFDFEPPRDGLRERLDSALVQIAANQGNALKSTGPRTFAAPEHSCGLSRLLRHASMRWQY